MTGTKQKLQSEKSEMTYQWKKSHLEINDEISRM